MDAAEIMGKNMGKCAVRRVRMVCRLWIKL